MADEVPNLTHQILREIRDELRKTNHRLEETNQRLDEGFKELGGRIERLETAVVRMGKVNDAVLDEQIKDSERLDGHEVRLGRLEQHTGLPPLGSK